MTPHRPFAVHASENLPYTHTSPRPRHHGTAADTSPYCDAEPSAPHFQQQVKRPDLNIEFPEETPFDSDIAILPMGVAIGFMICASLAIWATLAGVATALM